MLRMTSGRWAVGLGMLAVLSLSLSSMTALAQQEKAKPKRASSLEGARVLADLPYLGAERAEKGDLYLPKEPPANGALIPAVILIHGGGFTGGDKADPRERHCASTLVQNGYAAFSINYQLWSEAVGHPTWPQNLYDAKTAVRWLKVHGKKYGIDPERIGAIGFSAGGTLSSLLALTVPGDGFDQASTYDDVSASVRCAMDFYGPVDLLDWAEVKMLMKSRREDPAAYREASPITYAKPGRTTAPLMILHGTGDTTVALSQSEAFASALKKAGAPHELLVVEGAPHSFHFQPKERDLRPVVLGFLDRYLKSGE